MRIKVRGIILIMFFMSGVTSLIYEVSWFRQLSLTLGVSAYSAAAVVSAFMGGLALGGWLGSKIIKRVDAIKFYACLQLLIACCAFLTPVVFKFMPSIYTSLYNEYNPDFYLFNLLRFGLACMVLLWPTTLIGMTFPAVSQAYTIYNQRGKDLGSLYSVNAIGSVLGALLSGLVLIRLLGTRDTILISGIIDLMIAALAFAISSRIVKQNKDLRTLQANPQNIDLYPKRLVNIAFWGFALSGFVSLGYEVVWFRILSNFTLNSVYSFTVLLSIFILGLSIGSFLASRLVDSAKSPISAFAIIQLGIGVSAVLSLYVFHRLPTILLRIGLPSSALQEITIEVIAAALTIFVPTVLIGATFPLAARIYTNSNVYKIGNPAGKLYGANTVFSMIGSLVAGFLLIPTMGLQKSVLMLALVNILIGIAALLQISDLPKIEAYALLGTAAIGALLLPQGVFLGFREGTNPYLVYYKEGVDANVSVFIVPNPPLKISFVNGRNEVPTDRYSMRAFYLMGHLPALLKPDAKSALVLSFGNGIATGALSRHKIQHIDAVEIVAQQVEAARFYQPENRNVLSYPGLNITIEDARNYLLRSDKKYDIITADATHPTNSSSWAMFTQEFYKLARSHLSPDGVMVQWLPIHDISKEDYISIIKTFQSVFPHTTLWYVGSTHTLLVATPHKLSTQEVLALDSLIDKRGIRDDLIDSRTLVSNYLMNEDQVRKYSSSGSIVTDDKAFFLPAMDDGVILQSFQLAK